MVDKEHPLAVRVFVRPLFGIFDRQAHSARIFFCYDWRAVPAVRAQVAGLDPGLPAGQIRLQVARLF